MRRIWIGLLPTFVFDQDAIAQLQKGTGLSLVRLWLAGLLGGLEMRQSGGFYDGARVKIALLQLSCASDCGLLER